MSIEIRLLDFSIIILSCMAFYKLIGNNFKWLHAYIRSKFDQILDFHI